MSKVKIDYHTHHSHFINGEKYQPNNGSEVYHIINPTNLEKLNTVVLDDIKSVDIAVESSKLAFIKWSKLAMHKRVQLLINWYTWIKNHQDEFIELITLENGKPKSDATGEFIRGLEVLQYAISLQPLTSGKHAKVNHNISIHSVKEPLGVCVGICPFNFPFMIPMWTIPIAIALGNTIIIKPSEKVPSCLTLLAEGAILSGIYPGVINLVQGGVKVVNKLIEHKDTKAITFVGSTNIGHKIHNLASINRKKVQCNMGAKNHAVITSNSDLNTAVNGIVGAAFGGAGQRCMAISVVIIIGDNSQFIKKLKQKIDKINIIEEMGPLINQNAIDNINIHIDHSLKQNSEIILDKRLDVPSSGFYMGPVVLKTNVNTNIYNNELFGPVLSIINTTSLENAIQIINENPYGNGTCLFSDSLQEISMFQDLVEVGQIGINLPIPVPPPYFSWSSSKDSFAGNNYIYGPQSIDFYTKTKTIMTRGNKTFKEDTLIMPTN